MDLSNWKIKEIHISNIRSGDTILHLDGIVRTICKSNIKSGFCGITLFGDSYNMGTIKVKSLSLIKS